MALDTLGLVAMVAHLDRVLAQSSSHAIPMTNPRIQHPKGNGCFLDVMKAFPYERLWELLNDPKPIDHVILEYVINWCRPATATGTTFIKAVLDTKLLETRSDVFRKVREGGMKWNGQRVTDVNMPIEFLAPGWGVVQLGRKTHRVLLDRGWSYADPNHPYDKEKP